MYYTSAALPPTFSPPPPSPPPSSSSLPPVAASALPSIARRHVRVFGGVGGGWKTPDTGTQLPVELTKSLSRRVSYKNSKSFDAKRDARKTTSPTTVPRCKTPTVMSQICETQLLRRFRRKNNSILLIEQNEYERVDPVSFVKSVVEIPRPRSRRGVFSRGKTIPLKRGETRGIPRQKM